MTKQNELISKGVYEQVRWERDIAISQLESYGVDLGQKADVVKVVRCKDCKHYTETIRKFVCFHPKQESGFNSEGGECLEMKPNDFCSYGERKDDVQ